MKLATPKGFRDLLPADAIKRRLVIQKLVTIFEKFGFDPLETPTVEYAETLKGKYGEDEKLIYEFTDRGGDQLALRYDQTVPTSRVVAQYGPHGLQKLPTPFRRYQIQSAFRGENTQKGRYREFLQCDGDIIGLSSPLADAEILALVYALYQCLGLEIIIKINDRDLLYDIEPKFLSVIDKLNKIGDEGVLKELEQKGLDKKEAFELLNKMQHLLPSNNLSQITSFYKQMGYPQESLKFDPTMVRGLDYYTGLIFEVVLSDQLNGSSLCGGGRYDHLIGKFTLNDVPATGFAIGFDRTIEAMEEEGLLNTPLTNTQVLVTVFNPELLNQSLLITQQLRAQNINSEVWLDPNVKLDKQLRYADSKGIPYVVIIGPDEAQKNLVTLKDLKNKTQKVISLDEVCTLILPS